METQELQAIVSREINDARGYDSDELSENRRQALKYYMGEPRGDEIEGRSGVISLDVTDQVNSCMAQIAPMLKSTLVEFTPTGPEDEDAATLESEFCMKIANESNTYLQFTNAAFDALLQSNGWIKCFVDDIIREWDETLDAVPYEIVTDMITPSEPGEVIEITSQTEVDPDHVTLKLHHKWTERRLVTVSVAPEYMMFSPGSLSMDMEDCRMVAEKKMTTRSELQEMGYPKTVVDNLPTVNYETWDTATERTAGYDDKRGGNEPSTETVDLYEIYLRVDYDGDGIAELRRIMAAGFSAEVILENEPAKFVPYCTGAALTMPHRLTGTSMFDLLKPVADAKTHTLRQLLDNSNVANNSRVGAVEGECNMDDVANSKPGGVIRMRTQGAVFPIPFNDVGMSCLQTLGYLDQIRSERGGSALEMQTGQMQIAATSATGAANEYANKEKMSSFYCRNLVESLVRGTYLLIHQCLRNYYDTDLQQRIGGKWQSTNPKKWRKRTNVRVIAGLSSAERNQKVQALAQTLQYQMTALQGGMGGTLVNEDKIHATMSDWLRASELNEIDSYFVDPSSDEANQAREAKQKAEAEEAKRMEDLQQGIVDNEQALDKYKHDTQLQFDKWDAQLKASIEEMKVVGSSVADQELELTRGLVETSNEVADDAA